MLQEEVTFRYFVLDSSVIIGVLEEPFVDDGMTSIDVHRVQNKEWKVHGQMAKYFNKCLAIYKSTGPFYVILWIWYTKY